MKEKSVFNLEENKVGALCYLLGWFSGIFFLIAERRNKFVRFHALQSTIWFGVLTIIMAILDLLKHIWLIGILFGIVSGIVGFVMVISWLVLMFMAYRGARFKIPVLGDAVEEHTEK